MVEGLETREGKSMMGDVEDRLEVKRMGGEGSVWCG